MKKFILLAVIISNLKGYIANKKLTISTSSIDSSDDSLGI